MSNFSDGGGGLGYSGGGGAAFGGGGREGKAMTLAEQREKLIEIINDVLQDDFRASSILDAISVAGFSIVGPEVDQELGGLLHYMRLSDSDWGILLAAGDLARKPE